MSTFKALAFKTRNCPVARARSSKGGRKRSSISMARTLALFWIRARVNPPGPGPISATFIPSNGAANLAILSVIFISRRKCWPRLLLAHSP